MNTVIAAVLGFAIAALIALARRRRRPWLVVVGTVFGLVVLGASVWSSERRGLDSSVSFTVAFAATYLVSRITPLRPDHSETSQNET